MAVNVGGLVMMKCDRMALTLSTAGCARMHRKAQEEVPPSWDPKSACQFCPIGAANAGSAVAPLAEAAQSLARHCQRCQKPAARRINGMYCVSCYNRDREARIGKNAKGTRPQLCDRLHTAEIVVTAGMMVSTTSTPRVANRVEAMARLSRTATTPMYFGVPALRLEQRA